MSPAPRSLNIFVYCVDEVGPQNACIGIGQVLLSRGHQVSFLTKTDNSRQGKFSQFGFKVLKLKEGENGEESISEEQAIAEKKEEVQMWKKMGMFEDIDPVEKMKRMMSDDSSLEFFIKQLTEHEIKIKQYIDQQRPDLIIVDSIGMVPPSLIFSGIPWVYIYCSNPIGAFNTDQLPPPNLGFPVNGPRDRWPELHKLNNEKFVDPLFDLNVKLMKQFGYQIPADLPKNLISPYLNLYQYPKELDYDDVIQIPENYLQVDAFCRQEPGGAFELPAELKNKMKPGNKLLYFSLGTIATSNTLVMQRVIDMLAQTPHFYIISLGLFGDQLRLGERMWGSRYLPQTKVFQVVDAAIIHGGNNSLTEAFHFALPFIVMPVFFDQYDNATRVVEKGYGRSLNPYSCTEEELNSAIEEVLTNQNLKEKMVAASRRIQAGKSKERACEAMEQVVEKFSSRIIGSNITSKMS